MHFLPPTFGNGFVNFAIHSDRHLDGGHPGHGGRDRIAGGPIQDHGV